MSTAFRKDGKDLVRLIAGETHAWWPLMRDWGPPLKNKVKHKFPPGWDLEEEVGKAWKAAFVAVSKWPADGKGRWVPDKKDGALKLKNDAFTLGYLIKSLSRRAASVARRSQPLVLSLDRRLSADSDATLGSLIAYEPKHDPLPDDRKWFNDLMQRIFGSKQEDWKIHMRQLMPLIDALGEVASDEVGLVRLEVLSVLMSRATPSLTEIQMAAMVLHWVEEMTLAEISQALNPQHRKPTKAHSSDLAYNAASNWTYGKLKGSHSRIRAGWLVESKKTASVIAA